MSIISIPIHQTIYSHITFHVQVIHIPYSDPKLKSHRKPKKAISPVESVLPQLPSRLLQYRSKYPKVRGGWTKDKIKKSLRHVESSGGELAFNREVLKFSSPADLAENLFYHGSGGGIHKLKPSIVLNIGTLGGGYGEKYWGISLSKSRQVASSFTGQSSYGSVAPVLLKKGATVKSMPQFSDAVEVEDVIEQLWDEGIDAVKLGDWSSAHSEQEMLILNPLSIVVGPSTSFSVYRGPGSTPFDSSSFSSDQIHNIFYSAPTEFERLRREDFENTKDTKNKKTSELNATMSKYPEYKPYPMRESLPPLNTNMKAIMSYALDVRSPKSP
jgi:hypothetical protein